MPAVGPETYLVVTLLAPLLGALLNGLFGPHFSRRTTGIIGVGSAFIAALSAALATSALADQPHVETTLFSWIAAGPLRADLTLYLDPLSGLMALVVTGIGALIHLYSVGYMHDDPSYARYFSHLNLFLFAMLLLVLAKNLLVLFVGWEGVGLCSYLLIGFWYDDPAKALAGKKAFIVNRVGDLGFLLGLFGLLFMTGGTLDIPGLAQATKTGLFAPGGTAVTLITLALFIGATGKSAQIPLYVWLPDAMAGPTPVSALIHAATMVTAGVYLIARLNFLFALAPMTLAIIALTGAATALFAASIGLVQHDIKKVLAYSTISQLGYMMMAVGLGAFSAAIFHLMTHAFFKACLFLGAGSVIHALHGEQDIRRMGGLGRAMPVTRATFFIATMAIAGVPLLSGFFSKDEILFGALTLQHMAGPLFVGPVCFGIGLETAFLTAIYMFRLYFLTFCGERRGDAHAHESPWTMTVPLVLLAAGSVLAGYVGLPFANLLEEWLAPVFQPGASAFVASSSHSLELVVMAVSSAVAIFGIALSYGLWLGRFKHLPGRLATGPIYRLILDKYRVDELYGAIFVRPFQRLAAFAAKVLDGILIDGLAVSGPPRALVRIGGVTRLLANGDVQAYAGMLFVGLALLVFLAW